MKIYHYNPETFEFVGESDARKSPREKDVYLIPANATEKPPLENKEEFLMLFSVENDEWEYVEIEKES